MYSFGSVPKREMSRGDIHIVEVATPCTQKWKNPVGLFDIKAKSVDKHFDHPRCQDCWRCAVHECNCKRKKHKA